MPSISVIVPIYNTQEYLSDCVDSILQQTFKDFELILINDGSPDDSERICRSYQDIDVRVRYYKQKNQGLSAARNKGVVLSDSEWITFVDSDDVLHPKFLEVFYETAQKQHSDVLAVRLKPFYDGQIPVSDVFVSETIVCDGREAVKRLYKRNETITPHACAKLYKRSLFNSVSFPEGKIHEDQFFVPKALYLSQFVTAINAEMYYYRQRPESIMSTVFSVNRFHILEAMDNNISFFENNQEPYIASLIRSRKSIYHYECILNAAKSGVIPPEEYRISKAKSLIRMIKNSKDDQYICYHVSKNSVLFSKALSYVLKLLRVLRIRK